MTKTKIAHFKTLLDAELVMLVEELSAIATQNKYGDWQASPERQEDEAEADETDQADIIVDFEAKVGKLEVLEKRYNQVVTALERIENGTYGRCLKSGVLIEEDRLEANPAAETCKAMMNLRTS